MNKKPLILLPILLAAAAGGGYWWWRSHQGPATPSQLTLYGNVDIREVDLAFVTSERVQDVLVEEGDRVKPGQVVARLHAEKLKAAVAAAAAQVSAQQQVVARFEAGSRPEEIRQAKAQAEAAEAKARSAEITYQRQLKLGKQKLAAPEDVDQAQAAAEAAKGDAQAAEEAYALAMAGPRQEDIAQARATLEAFQADLALAKARLDDAVLHAPATGIVRERILQPGDMASPQSPALTLALINPLWVRAYVPEPDLGRIAPGMKAEVRTDSFPGKVYQGWVGFISPTAEFTPKNVETPDLRTRLVYQVRVFVCNPRDELRLGMPATVTIPLDQPAPGPETTNNCDD
jgi:HlyD family secretion protein